MEVPSLSGGAVNTCSPIYSVLWVTRWGREEELTDQAGRRRPLVGSSRGGCEVAMGRCGRGWGGGSRRGVLSSSSWGGRTGGWGPPSACQVRERGPCRPGWVGAGGHRPCSLPGPGTGEVLKVGSACRPGGASGDGELSLGPQLQQEAVLTWVSSTLPAPSASLPFASSFLSLLPCVLRGRPQLPFRSRLGVSQQRL